MMHTETGESPLLSPAFRAETVINPSGYGNRDAACAKTRKCAGSVGPVLCMPPPLRPEHRLRRR